MLSFNQIKLGSFISIDNQPYQVIKTEHSKVARGGAVLRTKLKNIVNGAVLEKTYKSNDQAEEADLGHARAQFLYKEDEEFFFMDNESYEQFSLRKENLGLAANFLKEDNEVEVLSFNDQPISVSLPPKIDLKVTSAPPGIKGDSAGNVTKKVTTETGYVLDVPLFVNEGDSVRINTETGLYVERA